PSKAPASNRIKSRGKVSRRIRNLVRASRNGNLVNPLKTRYGGFFSSLRRCRLSMRQSPHDYDFGNQWLTQPALWHSCRAGGNEPGTAGRHRPGVRAANDDVVAVP